MFDLIRCFRKCLDIDSASIDLNFVAYGDGHFQELVVMSFDCDRLRGIRVCQQRWCVFHVLIMGLVDSATEDGGLQPLSRR